MRMWLAGLVLASVPVVGVGLAPSTSALSCVGPAAVLRDSSIAFTGKVTAWSERSISIDVDEVWKGAVRARVTYDVEMPMWWGGDIFGNREPVGQRLVFAPREGRLNSCQVWALRGQTARDVRAFRPARPGEPIRTAPVPRHGHADRAVPATSYAWMWAAGGGLVTLLGAAAVLLARVGRRTR